MQEIQETQEMQKMQENKVLTKEEIEENKKIVEYIKQLGKD